MFCKNCGTEFADGAKFCKNCGQSLEVVQEEAPVAEPITEEASAEEPAEPIIEETSAEEPAEVITEETSVEEPAEPTTEEAPVVEETKEEAPANEPIIEDTSLKNPIQQETPRTQTWSQQEFYVESVPEQMDKPQKKQPKPAPDYYQPNYQQNYQNYQPKKKKGEYSPYPVINGVKKAAASKTTLIANILYTIALLLIPLLCFFALDSAIPEATAKLDTAIVELDIKDYEHIPISDSIDIINIVALVLAGTVVLPMFFFVLGKWFIYLAGSNRRKTTMNGVGFGFNKFATVIRVIFNCVILGGTTLMCLFTTVVQFIAQSALDGYSLIKTEIVTGLFDIEEEIIPYILLFATIAFGLIFILDLIYNIKILSTSTALADMGKTGRKSIDNVSIYLLIMLFFVGAIFASCGMLIAGIGVLYTEFLLSLAVLGGIFVILGASYILDGISLAKAKSETKKALASLPKEEYRNQYNR